MPSVEERSELIKKLLCAAQGEYGPFDPDTDSGWTARLLRQAADALMKE